MLVRYTAFSCSSTQGIAYLILYPIYMWMNCWHSCNPLQKMSRDVYNPLTSNCFIIFGFHDQLSGDGYTFSQYMMYYFGCCKIWCMFSLLLNPEHILLQDLHLQYCFFAMFGVEAPRYYCWGIQWLCSCHWDCGCKISKMSWLQSWWHMNRTPKKSKADTGPFDPQLKLIDVALTKKYVYNVGMLEIIRQHTHKTISHSL